MSSDVEAGITIGRNVCQRVNRGTYIISLIVDDIAEDYKQFVELLIV